MTRTLKLLAVAAAMMIAPLAATTSAAYAQTPPVVPTPEGTTITNTASVSYTDANGNTYTPPTATLSLTVVFKAGIDVTGTPTLTPASPSTSNTAIFTLTNTGNGTDQYQVAVSATGLTNVSYIYSGTPYATVALLNAALASVNVAAPTVALTTPGAISITVQYDVPDALGGSTLPITLTATSVRTPATTDAFTTNVIPPVAGTVTVNALSPTSASRLPSGPGVVTYQATFEVRNDANLPRTFTLTGATSNANGAIVSTHGTAGTTGTISLAANTIGNVTIVYTVANVAAGQTFDVTLSAVSGAFSDSDAHSVTVVRPALTIAKAAFASDQSTPLLSGASIKPGDTVWYRITIENVGSANGASVTVTDALPKELAYVSNTTDGGGWLVSTNVDGITAATTVTATLSAAMPFSPTVGFSRYIWIRTTVR